MQLTAYLEQQQHSLLIWKENKLFKYVRVFKVTGSFLFCCLLTTSHLPMVRASEFIVPLLPVPCQINLKKLHFLSGDTSSEVLLFNRVYCSEQRIRYVSLKHVCNYLREIGEGFCVFSPHPLLFYQSRQLVLRIQKLFFFP